MQITKQYIEENLLTVRGLNSNLTKKLKETTEELYLIYNNMELPKCSGNNNAKFKSFTKGYLNVCGDMKCQCYKDRYKRTQETLKKTNLEKYGVECTFAAKGCREKKKQTSLEKYGNENYNNSSSISETLLNKTDEENLLAHEKSKITRLEKYGDETFRNISKQKQTKLEKYGDENYNNAEIAQEQKRKTMENQGLWIPLSSYTDWELYRYKVRQLTEKQDLSTLENFDKRGFVTEKDAYHVDHIISIYNGFTNNIPIHIIADINNLQMLPALENILKGA